MVPGIGPVDEQIGIREFVEDTVRTGAGGVAGSAHQLGARGRLTVVEVDLLVEHAAGRVAVVIAGEAALGHEGEVAAVGGDAGFPSRFLVTPPPVRFIGAREHGDEADAFCRDVVTVEVAFADYSATEIETGAAV